MRIIGPPTATQEQVTARATDMGATVLFTKSMLPALWVAALQYGIDPVGIVAQSFKETGGGKFGGKVTPDFFNTGGIKIRNLGFRPETTEDQPLAHQIFWSWEVGAIAHVQHVCCYTGLFMSRFVGGSNMDPRWDWVRGKHVLENWSDFGGKDAAGNIKWAPSSTYGVELEAIMRRLQGKS